MTAACFRTQVQLVAVEEGLRRCFAIDAQVEFNREATALSINHALDALHKLNRAAPGIAQEGQFVAVSAMVDFAVQGCARGDQAAALGFHVLNGEGQMISDRMMIAIIQDLAQGIAVDSIRLLPALSDRKWM